jgi:hypothetical protein
MRSKTMTEKISGQRHDILIIDDPLCPVESTKTFVTFGQSHVHRVNNKTFDKDCVAVVHGDRETVFELFGSKFCFEYPEEHWDESILHFFPRGYIEAN